MAKNPLPEAIFAEIIVPVTCAGLRLDQALAIVCPEYSRSRLTTWIKSGQVRVDNVPRLPKERLKGLEHIVIYGEATDLFPENTARWEAENVFRLESSIVAEDDAVMVINKPAGLVVHPGAGNAAGTLANALLHYCPALKQVPRAGIVHRLDKGTTGLLVIAKTPAAHTSLVAQLQARKAHREYYAVVNGVLIAGGTVDKPLGRHPVHRQKRAVLEHAGKPAVTHYRIVERFRAHTLLKALLETGRTHQIRVHLASLGYPLVGDKTYGARALLPKQADMALIDMLQQFKRPALHARRLSFVHPETGENVSYEAPLPEDLKALIGLLQKDATDARGDRGNEDTDDDDR